MPDKSQKLVNTGINTDPLNWEDYEFEVNNVASTAKLKIRDDVKHIHLSDSSTLHVSYSFGSLLGQGSFGTVIGVCEKDNKQEWAMKIITKTIVPRKMNAIKREILILKMVSHPNIVLLHKVFETTQKIYLLLEKCSGELRTKFLDSKPFTEPDTRTIIIQLSGAVAYLHKNEIVHRDLKLENILLSQNPTNPEDTLFIKVSDFGLGFVKGTHYERLHDRCGTLTYISPEIITKGNYSQQCDVWAMGVIMYLLLVGEFPFYSAAESELTRMICHAEPRFARAECSGEALHLLKKMLEKDPALRITAGEVTMHPWLHGKPLSEKTLSANVLDMMKMWKTEMMVPRGSDCDWLTTKVAEELKPEKSSTKGGRQTISLPVHNIEFNRGRISQTQQDNSESLKSSTGSGLISTNNHQAAARSKQEVMQQNQASSTTKRNTSPTHKSQSRRSNAFLGKS